MHNEEILKINFNNLGGMKLIPKELINPALAIAAYWPWYYISVCLQRVRLKAASPYNLAPDDALGHTEKKKGRRKAAWDFLCLNVGRKTSLQSSKLRYFKTTTDTVTDRLMGVKCRATSVAKNSHKGKFSNMHCDYPMKQLHSLYVWMKCDHWSLTNHRHVFMKSTLIIMCYSKLERKTATVITSSKLLKKG